MKNFSISKLAEMILTQRKLLGLTQQELANALNVSKVTVCNWETGKTEPSLSQLILISKLSGIPMDYILVPLKSNIKGLRKEVV